MNFTTKWVTLTLSSTFLLFSGCAPTLPPQLPPEGRPLPDFISNPHFEDNICGRAAKSRWNDEYEGTVSAIRERYDFLLYRADDCSTNIGSNDFNTICFDVYAVNYSKCHIRHDKEHPRLNANEVNACHTKANRIRVDACNIPDVGVNDNSPDIPLNRNITPPRP